MSWFILNSNLFLQFWQPWTWHLFRHIIWNMFVCHTRICVYCLVEWILLVHILLWLIVTNGNLKILRNRILHFGLYLCKTKLLLHWLYELPFFFWFFHFVRNLVWLELLTAGMEHIFGFLTSSLPFHSTILKVETTLKAILKGGRN